MLAGHRHGRDPVVRLDFLMRYLAWRIGENLATTIAALNADLGYTIPPAIPDADGRAWRDPVVPELRTVIHAPRQRTRDFTLVGRGQIAGLAVHSCGAGTHGRLCWTTAIDLPPGGTGAATCATVDALWALPAWRARASFDFEWLEPAPRDRPA